MKVLDSIEFGKLDNKHLNKSLLNLDLWRSVVGALGISLHLSR